jgi:hypothetical protein
VLNRLTGAVVPQRLKPPVQLHRRSLLDRGALVVGPTCLGKNAMIHCKCSHCGKPFQIRDIFAGKVARCTGCRQLFRVPVHEEVVELEVIEDE